MGKITGARITYPNGFTDMTPATVFVNVDKGAEQTLFTFYHDEINFRSDEFIGLTLEEAKDLKRQKDTAYIRS